MPSTVSSSRWITIADEDKKGECIKKVVEYIGTGNVSQVTIEYASVPSEILRDIIIQYDDDSITMKCNSIIQYQGYVWCIGGVPKDAPVGTLPLCFYPNLVTLFQYSRDEWVLVIGSARKRVSQGSAALPSKKSEVYIMNIVSNPDFAETLLRIHNFCVFLLENDHRRLFNDYVNNCYSREFGNNYHSPPKYVFDHFATYCQHGEQFSNVAMEWDIVKKEGVRKVPEQVNSKNNGRRDKEFTTADKIATEVEIGDLIEFERYYASAGIHLRYKHWAVVVGHFVAPTGEENVYIVHYAHDDQEVDSLESQPILLRFDKLKDTVGNARINNLHDFAGRSAGENEFGVLRRVSGILEKKPTYNVEKLNCEHMATFCRYGYAESVQSNNWGTVISGLTLGVYCCNTKLNHVYLAELIYIFLVYLYSRVESAVMFRTGVLVGVQSCILLATVFSPLESRKHFLFANMSLCNKVKLVLVVSVLSYVAFKSGEKALISELGICYIAITSLGYHLFFTINELFLDQVKWINEWDKYWVKLGRFGLVTRMLLDGYRCALRRLTRGEETYSYPTHPLNKTVIDIKYMLMHVVVLALLWYAAFRSDFNNFAPGIAVIFIVVLIEISADWIMVGFDRFVTYCLFGQWYSKTQMLCAAVNGEGIILYFEVMYYEEQFTEERTISFPSWLGNNISLRLQLETDSFNPSYDEFTVKKVTIFFPNWLTKSISNTAVEWKSKKYPIFQFTTVITLVVLMYSLLEIGTEFSLLMCVTVLYCWSELRNCCANYILLATMQSFVTSIIATESMAFVVVFTYIVLAVTLMCKLKRIIRQHHIVCGE